MFANKLTDYSVLGPSICIFTLGSETGVNYYMGVDYNNADWKDFESIVKSCIVVKRQNYAPIYTKTIDDDINYLPTVIVQAEFIQHLCLFFIYF